MVLNNREMSKEQYVAFKNSLIRQIMIIGIDEKCGLSIYRKHNFSRHFQICFFLLP